MKKYGQYEEKIIQICKQEFGFSVKEVLDSLKEGIERNVLKKVYKNNKSSYRILKELVVEDKQDVVRGKEGEKNICNSISYGTEEATTTTINMGSQTDMISFREFQDFKAEVQQEIAKLRRDFNYKVNQISPSKVSVFDSGVVLGPDDSNQNGDASKSIGNVEMSDFIITLLKDRISLLEQQFIEKMQ